VALAIPRLALVVGGAISVVVTFDQAVASLYVDTASIIRALAIEVASVATHASGEVTALQAFGARRAVEIGVARIADVFSEASLGAA
jgi:hypothetical protein